MEEPHIQGQRTPETDRINAAVKKEGERNRKKQERQLAEALQARKRPSWTDEQITVDIIDAIATLCQLLKGRDLMTEKAQDALEDLNDNADLFQLTRALITNEGGRRPIKL